MPPTEVFAYRPVSPAVAIGPHGVDITTPWARSSEDARSAILNELTARLAAAGEDDWKQYAPSSCEVDLTGAWWDDADWRRYEELLARVSRAVGAEFRAGDIVEVDDLFLVLGDESVWRPLPPSRFVTQLHHLGQGREPPPLPIRQSDEIPCAPNEVDSRSWPAPQMRLQALVLDAVTTAQPRYEPLLESLPSQYQAHAREVVDEFLNKDLRRGLRRSTFPRRLGN